MVGLAIVGGRGPTVTGGAADDGGAGSVVAAAPGAIEPDDDAAPSGRAHASPAAAGLFAPPRAPLTATRLVAREHGTDGLMGSLPFRWLLEPGALARDPVSIRRGDTRPNGGLPFRVDPAAL